MMNKKTKYTIFFDLDGTLFNTGPGLHYAMIFLQKKHHHPPINYYDFIKHIPHGSIGMVQASFQISQDHPKFIRLKQEFLSIYENLITNKTKLYDGMEEVLDYLDNKHWQWGIVTSKPSWLCRPLLTHFNLQRRYCCLVMGDTLTLKKPDPAPLLHACHLSKCVAHQALYVGDEQNDMIAAKKIDMKAVAALYGYDPTIKTSSIKLADYQIERPYDLIHYLETLNYTND